MTEDNMHFIGRSAEIEDLQELIFVKKPGPGNTRSLMGPNEIGKTSLVGELKKAWEAEAVENVYCIDIALSDVPSEQSTVANFWNFWVLVINELSEAIPYEELEVAFPNPTPAEKKELTQIQKTYAYFANEDNEYKLRTGRASATVYTFIDKLFEAYTKLKRHVIMLVDEFDIAGELFPEESKDGTFFMKLFGLSCKRMEKLNLSILLIARRRVGTIAHSMKKGSDFNAAFQAYILPGFTDAELDEFWGTYENELDAEVKKDIMYVCGRHPGLLTKMRELLENTEDKQECNISKLYKEQGTNIKEVYSHMATLMKTEYVDKEYTVNCVNAFVQTYIGPAYENNLPNQIERLHDFGFFTKIDEKRGNIFKLTGINGYDYEYEPISPCFVDYFKNNILPYEADSLSKLMMETELKVRDVIKEVLQEQYADAWEEELDNIVKESAKRQKEQFEETAELNYARARRIEWSVIDFLSFNDYAYLIGIYWDDMEKYFHSYRGDIAALKEDFNFLRISRNCYAHHNRRILNRTSTDSIDTLCKRLMEDMENPFEGTEEAVVVLEEPAMEGRLSGNSGATQAPTKLSEEVLEQLAEGAEETFVCQAMKPTGGYNGYLVGYEQYPAKITKEKGVIPSLRIGDSIKVVFVREQSNNGFISVAPLG